MAEEQTPPSKKTPSKKTSSKKTPSKKTPSKKTPSKKTPSKKTPSVRALPKEIAPAESQADRLADAVNDVQLLIRHAAGSGKEVPKGLIETITKAAYDLGKPEFDAVREAEFWDTVAKVTHHVAPISIESIRYTREERGRIPEDGGWAWLKSLRHVIIYLVLTVGTLGSLIFTQIHWVAGSNLVSAIDEFSQSRNTLILDLARLNQEIQMIQIAKQGETTSEDDDLITDSAQENAALSAGLVDDVVAELFLKKQGLEDKGTRKTLALEASRLLLENWVSAYHRDPARPIKPGFLFFGSDEAIKKWEQKVKAWDEARLEEQETKTDLVYQQAQGVLQNMSGYYLPLLYGLLGALAYVLRSLSREISGLSFSRGSHVQYMLRLILGLLAGISVGWFLRPETDTGGLLDISPFALAFLAGYSVELVFTAMDKIIEAFSGASSTRKPA